MMAYQCYAYGRSVTKTFYDFIQILVVWCTLVDSRNLYYDIYRPLSFQPLKK